MGFKKEKKEKAEFQKGTHKIDEKQEAKLIKERKKELKKFKKKYGNILEIMPSVDFVIENERLSHFVLEDGQLCDYLQIAGLPLYTMSDDDFFYVNSLISNYLSVEAEDVSIIVSSFPTDTAGQIEYFQNRLKKTTNELLKNMIELQIRQLEIKALENETIEFYLKVYAKDMDELQKRRRNALSMLNKGEYNILYVMENEKKWKLERKLYNKNTIISAKAGEI